MMQAGGVFRFFVVALGGLIIDIAVASVLIVWFGWLDIAAAALGLFYGMVFNYFLHLYWTFAASGRSASFGHFARFAAGVGITLVVRAAVLWWIEAMGWQPLLAPPIRLGIGAAVSFVLSYAICRFVIFGPETVRPETVRPETERG